MTSTNLYPLSRIADPKSKFWPTVLLFGGLHFVIMTAGLVVEAFSGGCMFIIPAYFMVLVVVLPILKLRRFWAGTLVFLPYAVLGFPPTNYFEYYLSHSLWGLWGVFAWCLIGPLVGLMGDLAFRYLPERISERQRAILTGAVTGAAIFITTQLALTLLYRQPDLGSHIRFFTQGVYFSLPWLVINGSFAGFTAYAICKEIKKT